MSSSSLSLCSLAINFLRCENYSCRSTKDCLLRKLKSFLPAFSSANLQNVIHCSCCIRFFENLEDRFSGSFYTDFKTGSFVCLGVPCSTRLDARFTTSTSPLSRTTLFRKVHNLVRKQERQSSNTGASPARHPQHDARPNVRQERWTLSCPRHSHCR